MVTAGSVMVATGPACISKSPPCVPCPAFTVLRSGATSKEGGEGRSPRALGTINMCWCTLWIHGFKMLPTRRVSYHTRPSCGLFLHNGKLAVPDAFGLLTQLFQEMHDNPFAGHQGVRKTLKVIARHYWWPSMTQEVER
jgi:hypothetical protein